MFGINQKFEDRLETCAIEFNENLENYSEIVNVYHTDADGIGSAAIIKEMVKAKRKPFMQLSNTLEQDWKTYLNSIENKLKENSAIILSDLAPDIPTLNQFLSKHENMHVYILDHHMIRPHPDEEEHENIYNCNPTEFGLNGLKEIVGSALNYYFSKAVDESNAKDAWIAGITMAGDTLQHFEEYTSYNRAVAEDSILSGKIGVKEGICAFGGQFERIDKALSLSILPYIPEVEGNSKIAREILKKIGVSPQIKVEDLNEEEQDKIMDYFQIPNLKGKYLIVPKKNTLLRYTFEHAQLISILGHDKTTQAFSLLNSRSASKEQKQEYLNYIQGIINNLTTFVQVPKTETEDALIVDFTNKLDPSVWSDTSTFSTMNKIYNPEKILFVGGVTDNQLKLSVRCTKEFIASHQGMGANNLISLITKKIGGTGGGHDLAGGIRLKPTDLPILEREIDEIMKSYNPKEKN